MKMNEMMGFFINLSYPLHTHVKWCFLFLSSSIWGKEIKHGGIKLLSPSYKKQSGLMWKIVGAIPPKGKYSFVFLDTYVQLIGAQYKGVTPLNQKKTKHSIVVTVDMWSVGFGAYYFYRNDNAHIPPHIRIDLFPIQIKIGRTYWWHRVLRKGQNE